VVHGARPLVRTIREISMKKLSLAFLSTIALTVALVGTASAASPGKLRSDGTGTATITGAKSATLVNDSGEYTYVYVNAKSPYGKVLAKVDFGFNATGSIAGGAPRLSIPVDSDDAGSGWDLFAFIDVNSCGSGWVSTANPACGVYIGSEFFANWDALAAAHPTWRMARDTSPFAIADQAGTYHLSGIDLN
jgi:hypothetical protein